MLGGLTHEPVQKLANKLRDFLPGDLDYCFFSDSGSVAVEVSLKMALQYYVNRGEMKRTKVLSLTHAYHGDTFKAMEVGDDEDYHFILEAYGEKKNVYHIDTNIEALENAFEKHGHELNAFIVEPLLQGAGGMRMYDISFLQRARELCDEYDVLLIFDEVATGFGRTGNRFVADLVLPDILVLGKALACAAALKGIEIFERENYMEKIKKIEEISKREMEGFAPAKVREVRIMGGCTCVEVYDPEDLKGFQQFAYERGVFSRYKVLGGKALRASARISAKKGGEEYQEDKVIYIFSKSNYLFAFSGQALEDGDFSNVDKTIKDMLKTMIFI